MLPAAAAADHPMLGLSSFLKKSRVGQEAPCFSYFIQLLSTSIKGNESKTLPSKKNETIAHFNEQHILLLGCIAALGQPVVGPATEQIAT